MSSAIKWRHWGTVVLPVKRKCDLTSFCKICQRRPCFNFSENAPRNTRLFASWMRSIRQISLFRPILPPFEIVGSVTSVSGWCSSVNNLVLRSDSWWRWYLSYWHFMTLACWETQVPCGGDVARGSLSTHLPRGKISYCWEDSTLWLYYMPLAFLNTNVEVVRGAVCIQVSGVGELKHEGTLPNRWSS